MELHFAIPRIQISSWVVKDPLKYFNYYERKRYEQLQMRLFFYKQEAKLKLVKYNLILNTHYNELCQLDINIQKMNNNNKYKAEVLRLTEMLQNSFKEVQYYKKRDNEAQNLKQKIISQIDKLQQQNARLQQERDYYKQSVHEQPSNENKKLKNEYEGALVVAKAKNYIEKVNEIIKQIGTELKNKSRNAYDYNENMGAEHNILGLQKAFAKAAMGVIKYQQQFIKQSVDKQFMKLQIDKLRKQNTYLYQMTAKLQDNFAQADKITKRLNGEGKKLREQNQELTNRNNQLKAQLESRIKSSSKKITLSTSSSPQNPYEVPFTGKRFQSPQSQNKSSPNNNSHQYQLHINELVKKLQNKILLLEQENENLKSKDKEINNSGSNRQIYSFRQVSDSSEHQASQNVGSDKKIRDFSRIEQISEENKKLSKELITAESKIEKLQNQLSRIRMREQREEEKKYPELSKYSKKIESLQNECKQKSKQIESLRQQIENSQAQKDKIITVYQNESHESKDRIIRHQDALLELQKLAKSFKSKNEQLHKTNKLLSKQINEKNKEIESYMSLLNGKTEELNKLHCEYQKQKLINEVNNKNFANAEEKDQKISNLQAYVKQLIVTIDALEQQLSNKTKIATAQVNKIKEQKYTIQADYDHQKEKARLFEESSTEKDHIIKQLQEKLSQINKELNELAESWGVDDSFKIIELLKEKDRKNAQLIMDAMINKEKIINEKNSIEQHLSGSKDKLRKEKQQILSLSNGTIQKLSKIFKLNIFNESEDLEELGDRWNEILEKVEDYMNGTQKQREKMKQLQIIWSKKLSHIQKQLQVCKQDKQLLEDSINDLKEYAQMRDKEIEHYKHQILELENNNNNNQKQKQSQEQQNQEQNQEKSGHVLVVTSQIYEQEQSYVEQYVGKDKQVVKLQEKQQNQQVQKQSEQNKQNDQGADADDNDSEIDRLRNKVKQLEDQNYEREQSNRQIQQMRTILQNYNHKINELAEQNKNKQQELHIETKNRQSMTIRIQQLQTQNNSLLQKVNALTLLLQSQQQCIQQQICAIDECTQTEGQSYQCQWSQTQGQHMNQQNDTHHQYQQQELAMAQEQTQQITQQQVQLVQQVQILKLQAQTQTYIQVHDVATQVSIATFDDAQVQTQVHLTFQSCMQTQAVHMHQVKQCQSQQEHLLANTQQQQLQAVQCDEQIQQKQQIQIEQLNMLKQRINSMQGQIEQYKKNHQQQLHQYIKFQQQIELYQQETIALKSSLTQSQESKQQALNRISELQKQNKSRDCVISKIKLQYQSKINDLLLEADSLRNLTQSQKQEKEASIAEMQDKIADLQSTLKLYEYANVAYKNSISQVSDHLSQEIKDLGKNLHKKIAELEKKLQYMETCMREVVKVLKNKNNTCKEQMKISQMKSEVEISCLQVKTQKQMRELSEKSEKETRQLLKEIKQLQQRIQIFQDRLQAKQKELESKNMQILKLTVQEQEQMGMKTDLIVAQNQKITKQLELSLSVSKVQIQRYQAQLSEHKSKISEQEENVQKLCKQLQKNCEKLNNIEHLYQELTIQNKVLEQQKQIYTKKEQKYKKEAVMKNNQIQKSEQSIRKLQSMNIILQKQVKMYREQLKNLQSVNQHLYQMKQKQKQYKMREKKSMENIQQLYKVTLERNQVITKLKTDISQYIKKRDRQLCICKLDNVVVEIKKCIRSCQVGQQYETNQQVLQAGSQTQIEDKSQNKEVIEQINKKQRILIDRQHQINKKINILKQLQGKQSNQIYQQTNRQFNSGFEIQKQHTKHSQSIRPFVNKQQKKRDSNKENPQPQFQLQAAQLEQKQKKLQIPLQMNDAESETWNKNDGVKGTFSTRNTKEQALQKQLKITEQYRQILEAENKNLKKEILRKDKACAKLREFQKQICKCKKQIQKMSTEIDMKQKMLRKYDKEFKLKLEDNIKLKRNIENLNEELELEKKRNKNFQELYDKYKMQKKSIVQSAATSNDGKN